MKTVALIVRRPDHDRDTFRKHYEEIHAPLAMETVMEGTSRYVRHHVREEIHGEPGFDVVTSFSFPDAAASAALMKRLQGEAGKRIIEDERSFMDRDLNHFFGVTEHPVHGAADRSAGLSLVVLARAPEHSDRMDFVRDYERDDLPALLDTTRNPVWCLQNRSFAAGSEPAFDVVSHVHADAAADLGAWAAGLEARGAGVLVLGVSEHETVTPW